MRRLVEMAGEANFVADFGVGLDDPSIGRVGQNFTADEGFDSALLQQRDLLEARSSLSGSYSRTSLASTSAWEQAAKRFGLGLAGLVDFLDDGRRNATCQLTAATMSLSSEAPSLRSSFFSAASTSSRNTLWSLKVAITKFLAEPAARRAARCTTDRLISPLPARLAGKVDSGCFTAERFLLAKWRKDIPSGGGTRPACASRRVFRIHLPRAWRSATVRLDGRALRVVRHRRRLSAVVDLRDRPAGVARVRAVGQRQPGSAQRSRAPTGCARGNPSCRQDLNQPTHLLLATSETRERVRLGTRAAPALRFNWGAPIGGARRSAGRGSGTATTPRSPALVVCAGPRDCSFTAVQLRLPR